MVSGAKYAVQRHGDIALQHATLASFLSTNTRSILYRPYPSSSSLWNGNQKSSKETNHEAVLHPPNNLQFQSREARETLFIDIANGGHRHATFAPISAVPATNFSGVVKAIANERHKRPKRDGLRSSNLVDNKSSARPRQEHMLKEVSGGTTSGSNAILKIPVHEALKRPRSFRKKEEIKHNNKRILEELLSLCSYNLNNRVRLERFYTQDVYSHETPCDARTRVGFLRRFVHLNLRRNSLRNIFGLYQIISEGRKNPARRYMTTADLVAYFGTLLVCVARRPNADLECVQFVLKTYHIESNRDRDFGKHTNPAFLNFLATHVPLHQSLPEIEKRLHYFSQNRELPPTKFVHEIYTLLHTRLQYEYKDSRKLQNAMERETLRNKINEITSPTIQILPKSSLLIQNMLRYATSLEEVKHVRNLVQNSRNKAKILAKTNYHFLVAAFRTFPRTEVLEPYQQISRKEELVAMFLWLQKECPSGLSSVTMGVAAIIFSRIGAHSVLKRLSSIGTDFFSQKEDRKYHFVSHICRYLPNNGKAAVMNPTESAAFIKENILRKLLLHTIFDSKMHKCHQMTLLDAIRALGQCGDAVTISKTWEALQNLYQARTLLKDTPPTIISSLVASGDVTTANKLFRNVVNRCNNDSDSMVNPYITSRLISAMLPLPSMYVSKRQNGTIPINEIIACAAKQAIPWKFVVEDYIMRHFGANSSRGLGYITQVWGDEIQKCINEIYNEEKIGSIDESLLLKLEETFST